MTFYEHLIQEGDRYDLLAYKYFGDCNYSPLIVVDNPHLSVLDSMPAGEICYIRTAVEDEDSLATNETLPFWKR